MSSLANWPARVPWCQPDGTLTPEASRWLNRPVYERLGGSSAPTNLDLQILAELSVFRGPEGADIPSAFADQLLAPAATQDVPTVNADGIAPTAQPQISSGDTDPNARIQALEAEVFRLALAIQDLQQGYHL